MAIKVLAKVDAYQVAFQEIVEQIVTGLGYELVDVERSAGGLLRITIDLPWSPGETDGAGVVPAEGIAAVPEQFITVEDCEKVTRQLQFALEVEGTEYQRLEVSSPGLDRPLKSEKDFQRFIGSQIDVTLKAPLGAAANGGIHANRRKFRGTLEKEGDVWQIVWSEAPAAKPGAKVSKKRASVPVQALGFRLDELKEARLAPVVDFKGRKPKTVGES